MHVRWARFLIYLYNEEVIPMIKKYDKNYVCSIHVYFRFCTQPHRRLDNSLSVHTLQKR